MFYEHMKTRPIINLQGKCLQIILGIVIKAHFVWIHQLCLNSPKGSSIKQIYFTQLVYNYPCDWIENSSSSYWKWSGKAIYLRGIVCCPISPQKSFDNMTLSTIIGKLFGTTISGCMNVKIH